MKNVRIVLALSLLAIIGCASPHSTPMRHPPQKVVDDRTMRIWVDQDGTFFPVDWKADFGDPEMLSGRSAYSLGAMAHQEKNSKVKKEKIAQAEKSVLAEYRDFISDKQRLFILVHGYNNNEKQACEAYKEIKKKIALKKGDGVVEFYWDGLSAGGVRRLLIWFKATGNSQLVGTRGLRKILNATHGKKIVFITHSRGASVFLSALSDPPYADIFVTKTKRSRGFGVNEEPPLQRNGNVISALLLAPAIGEIDFRWPEHDPLDPMREFDGQLEDVYYSVNSRDWVLNKFIGLSKYFNASDMGLHVRVANRIDAADKPRKRFRHKEWKPMTTHGFLTYVKNDHFTEMLEDMKVDVRK